MKYQLVIKSRFYIFILIVIIAVLLSIIFFQNRYSFEKYQIESLEGSNKVVWYKVISPVKNNAKSYLIIKTDAVEGPSNPDTTRVDNEKITSVLQILQSQNVLYNQNKNLIHESEKSK